METLGGERSETPFSRAAGGDPVGRVPEECRSLWFPPVFGKKTGLSGGGFRNGNRLRAGGSSPPCRCGAWEESGPSSQNSAVARGRRVGLGSERGAASRPPRRRAQHGPPVFAVERAPSRGVRGWTGVSNDAGIPPGPGESPVFSSASFSQQMSSEKPFFAKR